VTNLNHELANAEYMIEALVDMLGPKGLEVWSLWQKNNIKRVHYSWGPKAHELTGEERASIILDMENTQSRFVNIGNFGEPVNSQPKVDVREFVKKFHEDPELGPENKVLDSD